jgi:hypothetical protein
MGLADARLASPITPIRRIQLMARYDDLKEFVESMERDFSQFYEKGNKAAGTRVRKGMQDLKKMAQDIRVEIQDKKSDM